MYVNVCKCIRNWPLPIGAFQDQCKQIVMRKLNAEIEEEIGKGGVVSLKDVCM